MYIPKHNILSLYGVTYICILYICIFKADHILSNIPNLALFKQINNGNEIKKLVFAEIKFSGIY